MDRKKKSYNLLTGIIALLAIVTIVALVGYIVSKPEPIVLQGQAEAAEYRVSGKVPGRVEKFYAGEGDFVHKGDTLVKIESPEVQAKAEGTGRRGSDEEVIRKDIAAVRAGSGERTEIR